MSLPRPTLLTRLALAAVAAPLLLAAPAADAAAPARAKTRKAKAKVIKLDKKYIEKPARKVTRGKATPTTPTTPAGGSGGVLPAEPGEWAFALSANTPNVPGGGYLLAHYPRDWEPNGQAGPGGRIWLSQNRLPNETYVKAQLAVKPTNKYEVTVCTEGSELVRVKVGNTSHTFPAGNSDCDLTFVLEPAEEGIASIMIEFVEPPSENGANAFAVGRVEVIRR